MEIAPGTASFLVGKKKIVLIRVLKFNTAMSVGNMFNFFKFLRVASPNCFKLKYSWILENTPTDR